MMFFFVIFCLCCASFVAPSIFMVCDSLRTLIKTKGDIDGALMEMFIGIGGLFVGFGMFFANYANFFPNIS